MLVFVTEEPIQLEQELNYYRQWAIIGSEHVHGNAVEDIFARTFYHALQNSKSIRSWKVLLIFSYINLLDPLNYALIMNFFSGVRAQAITIIC